MKIVEIEVRCSLVVQVEEGVEFDLSTFGFDLTDVFSTSIEGHEVVSSIIEDYDLISIS